MSTKYYAEWERQKEEREEKFFHNQVQKAINNNELVVTKRGVYKNLNFHHMKSKLETEH